MDITQHNLQKKNGVSYGTMILIVLITLVVAFFVVNNLNSIGNWISGGVLQQTGAFTIGESVQLSGEIIQNGDYVTHTHTLATLDRGVVGLKSKTIDLNQYVGQVFVQGVVTKQQNALFIVEVTAITGTSASSGVVALTGAMDVSEGVYIVSAGLYFSPQMSQQYTIGTPSNGEIPFVVLSSQQAVSLSYFACVVGDANKDCAEMVKNFSATAEKTFTTSRGDKFYKLEGMNSWFMTNNNFYGYFINDVPEQVVKDIANTIIFLNKDYVEGNLLSKATALCTDGTTSMQSVTSHTLIKDSNGLALQIQGTTANGTAQCKIVLDPSLGQGGQKLSYVVTATPSPIPSTTPVNTTTAPASALDFSVTQFPVSADKIMVYTSSRGQTITFPSRNISYGAVQVDEDLGINGLRCSSQMNVVKFSDKALLSTNPTIKIFECTAKKEISLPSNAFLQTKLSDGRIFVIQIMDGAWKDFAQNISIVLGG